MRERQSVSGDDARSLVEPSFSFPPVQNQGRGRYIVGTLQVAFPAIHMHS